MSELKLTYSYSRIALFATFVLAVLISVIFKWSYQEYPVNFMGGDAEDYYSSLISTFINKDLTSQTREVWFLLKTSTGTINQHPIGVALLILPFFLVAYLLAPALNYPLDGMSLPFQVAVAAAGLFYAMTGLIYFAKLCRLNGIGDRTTALVILLLFFGTNLLNYTLSEAGMSHVYSFALISVFLYHSCVLVNTGSSRSLILSGVIMGLIMLVRPNNVFSVLFALAWFRSPGHCLNFIRSLFRNRYFYLSIVIALSILFFQNLVWYLQTGHFFHQTYKADGFYFLHPQMLKMLFGFNAGFFIYTPICLLFLAGLFMLFRANRFAAIITGSALLLLFYFFSSYCSYTFFDGLGIRVLVDYYAVFGFLGAKLFEGFAAQKTQYVAILSFALMLAFVNLVYCYQANRGILLRAGMNFNKWKYVFMRTGPAYVDCLGGSNELTPFSADHPAASHKGKVQFNQPFNYEGRDYGVVVNFDSLGFISNRVKVNINCSRKEAFANASREAYVCMSLEDGNTKKNKFYAQFRLNEVPSTHCCAAADYRYSANLAADFRPSDRLSVYIWNKGLQPFEVGKFEVEVYNYNYLIN